VIFTALHLENRFWCGDVHGRAEELNMHISTYVPMHLCAQQLVKRESFGEELAASGLLCRPSLSPRDRRVYNIN
jgi:hypothetical protein